MTITEVPRSFLYSCDACGAEHAQRNASGYYTESTPPGWSTLKVVGRGDAPNGAIVRDEKLLCEECSARLRQAIKKEFPDTTLITEP